MKNFIFTMLALFALFSSANAQKIKWGITGGSTFSQVRTSDQESTDNTNYLFGFSVGVTSDLSIGKYFSFQPTLQFLQKGGKETGYFFTTPAKVTIRLNYLDLPLNFLYHAPGKTGHFVVGLGPSFSLALSGKEKFSSEQGTDQEDIHFGNKSDTLLKSVDIGGNLLIGYEWENGFYIQANYNHGLSNLWNDSDTKWKNAYFGLRVGYFFGRNRK